MSARGAIRLMVGCLQIFAGMKSLAGVMAVVLANCKWSKNQLEAALRAAFGAQCQERPVVLASRNVYRLS